MPIPARVDVLYIEDDDAWAVLVTRWADEWGLYLLPLSSGREMFSYLSRCKSLPACLLLDVSLPDADGFSLCAQVKRSPVLQCLPVVILTGRPVTARECHERQALCCLPKEPDVKDALGAALKSVISQHDRSRGVVDMGDLRMDPGGRLVFLGGQPVTILDDGQFAALQLLVQSFPDPVDARRLYRAFVTHASRRSSEPELTFKQTVRTYISDMRHRAGDELGARIQSVRGRGYAYRPPGKIDSQSIDSRA